MRVAMEGGRMRVAREYAFLSAEDAARVGIPLDFLGNPAEVGLLYSEDEETGEHWTHAGDAAIVRTVMEGSESDVLVSLEIPSDQLPFMRQGWPDDW
jgi:hypothetical protein